MIDIGAPPWVVAPPDAVFESFWHDGETLRYVWERFTLDGDIFILPELVYVRVSAEFVRAFDQYSVTVVVGDEHQRIKQHVFTKAVRQRDVTRFAKVTLLNILIEKQQECFTYLVGNKIWADPRPKRMKAAITVEGNATTNHYFQFNWDNQAFDNNNIRFTTLNDALRRRR